VWTWGAVERLLQDVRYASRVLTRQRAFTATAIATIVLIVGGTTAVFTLVNAVLLRPLPYPASNRLVMVRAHDPRGGTAMTYPEAERLRDQVASVEAWGLYRGPGYTGILDQNSDRPLPVQDMRVTPELFSLLGLKVAGVEDHQPVLRRQCSGGEFRQVRDAESCHHALLLVKRATSATRSRPTTCTTKRVAYAKSATSIVKRP
jgi:hypothetical protein